MKRDCTCQRARHVHGSRGAYQTDGCRCFTCRVNYSRIRAAYATGQPVSEAAWVSPVGIARRIKALHAVGWTAQELGDRLDISRTALTSLRDKPRARSLPSTLARVAALYDELWDVQPPVRPGRVSTGPITRTRQVAAERGWAPPAAWDDDEIDNPDATPHNPSGPSPWDLEPCGTAAAARRHYRRGERLDAACLNAARRQKNDRKRAA